MDQTKIFVTLLGMGMVTYLPRLLPVWLLSSRRLPEPVITWLRYVPASVLAALLFPAIFTEKGQLSLVFSNLYLLAAMPTLLVAWKTRSLFYAVITGMLCVALLRLVM